MKQINNIYRKCNPTKGRSVRPGGNSFVLFTSDTSKSDKVVPIIDIKVN